MRHARVGTSASLVRCTVGADLMRRRNVTHYSIPAFDETGGPIREPGGEIGSAKTRVTGGEVLISKLNPRKSRVQIVGPVSPDELAVCSGEFIALRPRSIDARYLRYALMADGFRQGLEAQVQSVTRSQQRVSPEDVLHGRIAVPLRRSEQSAIADFLDIETSRIDDLVVARKRQLHLVRLRRLAWLDKLVRGIDLTPARRVFERIDQGWSAVADETPATQASEVGVLRLNAVDGGEFFPDRNKRLGKSALRDDWRRFVISDGDLLVSRASGSLERVGESALVSIPQDGPTLLFPDTLYRLTPGPKIRGAFAALVMRSSDVRSHLREVARGTANSKIRSSDLRELLLPLPSLESQAQIVVRWSMHGTQQRRVEGSLDRQINLLRERRQALITAAVTGDLTIPETPTAPSAA